MDYKSAIDIIQNEPPRPMYLFYGEEPFFIELLKNEVVAKNVSPQDRDFNYTSLHGTDISDLQLLDAINEFPMMAERRYVICTSFDKIDAGDGKRLTKLFENPVESTVLVATAGKIDKRLNLNKMLIKNSFNVETKRLWDNQIPQFIRERALIRGYQAELDAAELLFSYLGSNLKEIDGAIEKLTIYLGADNKVIDSASVTETIGLSREFSAFELGKAIVAKDFQYAYKIGNYLIEKGDALVKIIAGVYFQINKMWQISFYSHTKVNDTEIAKKLRMRPFFVKQEKKIATNVTNMQYRSIMLILAEGDLRAKTTSISDRALFERIILEIQKCLE